MSKLKIVIAEGNGVLAKEVLWLEVLEDASLENYIVCDTTYTDVNHISNKLRHAYWFPSREAKKGDFVALRTKMGANTNVVNDKGTNTHEFFWNLKETVWNKDGDCAVLFTLSGWATHRV